MAEPDEDAPLAPVEDQQCPDAAPLWVVTFGDMMSLLLTFFILLLSFAHMQVVKFKIFTGSVMDAFGVQTVTPAFNRPQADNIVATEFSMDFSANRVFDGMKAIADRHRPQTGPGRIDIKVFEDYRGVVMQIDADGMFQPGKPDIRPAMWPILDDVIAEAVRNSSQIQVEAHTDSTPIHSDRFPNNDLLAAARAVSVVHYFLGRQPDLPPKRLEAVPMGAHRPVVPNINPANRKRNRRIEIVFREPVRVDKRPRE